MEIIEVLAGWPKMWALLAVAVGMGIAGSGVLRK